MQMRMDQNIVLIQLLLKSMINSAHQANAKTHIPFISQQENGFQIHSQALQFFASLPQHKHCHFISAFGKVKSGKSYLLNHLFHLYASPQTPMVQYFPVSNNFNNCTKGINLLTSWVQFNESILIFIDMEGLGSLDNTTLYESKLFAIAILLTSTLIYNNVGPIDEQSLQNLGLLIEIGKMFEKTMISHNKNMLGLPSLFMVLRDFSLQLQNLQGLAVTPKQYLEEALEQQKGISQVVSHKNRIRRVIKQLFRQRDCETLILPSEQLPIRFESALRPQFQSDIKRLWGRLNSQIKQHPKSVNSKLLNPNEYLYYVKQFLDIMNENQTGLPRIQNIFIHVYRKQVNAAKQSYLNCLNQLVNEYDELIDVSDSKIEQLLNGNESEGINQQEMFILENIILRLDMIAAEINKRYLDTCKILQSLINTQGIQVNLESINFNNPSITTVKQFKDIYQWKTKRECQILRRNDELKSFVAKQKAKKQEEEILKEQLSKFKEISQKLCLIQSQKQLQNEYSLLLHNLKLSNKEINATLFENNFLKCQIAYLRRKMELRQRSQCFSKLNQVKDSPLKDIINLKYYNANELKNKHTPILKSNENQTNLNDISQFTADFSKEQVSCKISFNKSFYVPYVVIQTPDVMNIEIIRTLIKQDSRQNNFIQYVLQVVLLDRRWTFNRRWKDFSQLQNILHNLFDNRVLPEFQAAKLTLQSQGVTRKEQVEARRSKLQQYLRQLLEVDQIRNSRIMQKFIKINKQYITTL